MLKRVLSAAVAATISIVSAQAGEEIACAEQYTFEEQLILEGAALGGDPHAQFAMAQCAFPEGKTALTTAERDYAFTWIYLAACDGDDNDLANQRKEMTRKLKASSDISFRRFGGENGGEKYSTRDELFRQYRETRASELEERRKRFEKLTSKQDRRDAMDSFAERFARMGPVGFARLGEMTSCKLTNQDDTFRAASLDVAKQIFDQQDIRSLYGKPKSQNHALAARAADALSGLSSDEQAVAQLQREDLLRTTPQRLAELEESAALAMIGQLSTPFQFSRQNTDLVDGATSSTPISVVDSDGIHTDGSTILPADMHGQSASTPATLTGALQFALEALGWMSFQNGPDNDYGPATAQAVQTMQIATGKAPTRFLNAVEIRDLICEAATEKTDPVSLYNLSQMLANGWGMRKDLTRANAAMSYAGAALDMSMRAGDQLPAWKQSSYTFYADEIKKHKKDLADKARAANGGKRPASVDLADLC